MRYAFYTGNRADVSLVGAVPYSTTTAPATRKTMNSPWS
jgi:hypothetical protein